MRSLWATVFLVLASACPAWAQSVEAPAAESLGMTRIELGGGFVGGVAPAGDPIPSVEVRVNISPRIAIEAVTDFETGRYSQGVAGLYALQVRQRVGDSHSRVTPFVTYGLVGWFQYRHVNGYQYTLATGERVVYPGGTNAQLSRPFALVGGGGVRVGLARHLFLEAGAQAVGAPSFAGLLFNAGVMVPIGRRR
jgi:hypothetical protein